MNEDELKSLIREQSPFVFDRMFAAVEKVRERLDRTCGALEKAGIPYAVIGGHAVAAWVATVDEGAVRNTRDVDILLQAEDLDRATQALSAVGFYRDKVMDVIVFLDGPDGKPSQGIHILLAGKKVKPDYVNPTPQISQCEIVNNKSVVHLNELVRMKLNSFRLQDRVHLLDMIGVGLIDASWPARFEPILAERLQSLLDNPDG